MTREWDEDDYYFLKINRYYCRTNDYLVDLLECFGEETYNIGKFEMKDGHIFSKFIEIPTRLMHLCS